MDEARLAYERWVDIREEQRASDFQAYAYNIAEARYVMRRVTRIANERAKKHDLDALLHQALLQIYGVGENEQLTVSKLAERLDVPAAFASRLVGQLEQKGLVRRESSTKDRRVTHVFATDEGVELLRQIDDEVHHEVAYFQRQISERQRLAALSIFAFYVGVAKASPIGNAIRSEAERINSTR